MYTIDDKILELDKRLKEVNRLLEVKNEMLTKTDAMIIAMKALVEIAEGNTFSTTHPEKPLPQNVAFDAIKKINEIYDEQGKRK